MTIILCRFKLFPFTRVLIAPRQRTFGHHNLSFNTVRGPLGTPRPGHGKTTNPILAHELKPPTPFSFILFLGSARQAVPDTSTTQESYQRFRLLLWSPGLYDASGGTDSPDGLIGKHARVASSATGSSLGRRLVNREPFDSLGHLNSPLRPYTIPTPPWWDWALFIKLPTYRPPPGPRPISTSSLPLRLRWATNPPGPR